MLRLFVTIFICILFNHLHGQRRITVSAGYGKAYLARPLALDPMRSNGSMTFKSAFTLRATLDKDLNNHLSLILGGGFTRTELIEDNYFSIPGGDIAIFNFQPDGNLLARTTTFGFSTLFGLDYKVYQKKDWTINVRAINHFNLISNYTQITGDGNKILGSYFNPELKLGLVVNKKYGAWISGQQAHTPEKHYLLTVQFSYSFNDES